MKTIKSANGKEYKVTESNTYYHSDTPENVINVLEKCRYQGIRIKLCYGDPQTGKNWHEENELIHYQFQLP